MMIFTSQILSEQGHAVSILYRRPNPECSIPGAVDYGPGTCLHSVDHGQAGWRNQVAYLDFIRQVMALARRLRPDVMIGYDMHGLTPTYIPYYHGQTYGYFVYDWMPRLLWPDKPTANVNEQIDVDYMLKQAGSNTSIGISQLPEPHIDFGLIGFILVMAIQGFVFALLDSSLNRSTSDRWRAIYLSVMIYFLNGVGSAAAVLFGALF